MNAPTFDRRGVGPFALAQGAVVVPRVTIGAEGGASLTMVALRIETTLTCNCGECAEREAEVRWDLGFASAN